MRVRIELKSAMIILTCSASDIIRQLVEQLTLLVTKEIMYKMLRKNRDEGILEEFPK